MITKKDRREFKRFRPQEGTMAINYNALGPVLDISMGGISFKYMGNYSKKSSSALLGIFLGSEDILIEEISTKVVSDKLIYEGSSFLNTPTRKRSMQFNNLTRLQREHLRDFIGSKTK